MKKGQDQVKVIDYFDPSLPELTLPLDPTKDPVWNMNDYFRKFHKYQGAQEHLRPRLETVQEDITKLESQLVEMEKGNVKPDAFPMKALDPFPAKIPAQNTSKTPSTSGRSYRTYTSLDGIPILVGKTAKDNDFLTFKVGKPDDMWLHARGAPGSHVIVRLEKHVTVPPETLKDAATLALWFSDLRKSRKGEVIYTARKFVKKGKGLKPGAVLVAREKSLMIEIQQDRLDRLKTGG